MLLSTPVFSFFSEDILNCCIAYAQCLCNVFDSFSLFSQIWNGFCSYDRKLFSLWLHIGGISVISFFKSVAMHYIQGVFHCLEQGPKLKRLWNTQTVTKTTPSSEQQLLWHNNQMIKIFLFSYPTMWTTYVMVYGLSCTPFLTILSSMLHVQGYFS